MESVNQGLFDQLFMLKISSVHLVPLKLIYDMIYEVKTHLW